MRIRNARGVLAIVVASAATALLLATLAPWLRADSPPAKGTFLVASPDLDDPNFHRTVVLLLEYDATGAIGLVINRPSQVDPAQLFPDIDALETYDGTLYVGGPVAQDGVMLLVRAESAPPEADHVFGDVYVTHSRVMLEQFATEERRRDSFRLYAGYAGWGAGQLDREIGAGGWQVVPARADIVFAEEPEWIWRRLAPGEPGQRASR